MLGFKSFDAAQCTLAGVELMHMIKQRQMVVAVGDEGLTAAELFYFFAASSSPGQGPLLLHDLLSKMCDKTVHYTYASRASSRSFTLRKPALPSASGSPVSRASRKRRS